MPSLLSVLSLQLAIQKIFQSCSCSSQDILWNHFLVFCSTFRFYECKSFLHFHHSTLLNFAEHWGRQFRVPSFQCLKSPRRQSGTCLQRILCWSLYTRRQKLKARVYICLGLVSSSGVHNPLLRTSLLEMQVKPQKHRSPVCWLSNFRKFIKAQRECCCSYHVDLFGIDLYDPVAGVGYVSYCYCMLATQKLP